LYIAYRSIERQIRFILVKRQVSSRDIAAGLFANMGTMQANWYLGQARLRADEKASLVRTYIDEEPLQKPSRDQQSSRAFAKPLRCFINLQTWSELALLETLVLEPWSHIFPFSTYLLRILLRIPWRFMLNGRTRVLINL
jgi:hypothetical protein